MNIKLRKNIYFRNMTYNKCKRGLVTWDVYRKQRNKPAALNKKSKVTYFKERCAGGNKNQQFLCTIEPFLSDKSACLMNKIIIKDDENITNNDKHICEFLTNAS